MARSRNIKPGFFRNEILAELPPITRLLFAGLWTVADKAGRLEDRPKRIKADVLPYDSGDIDAMLDALAEKSFIARYEHGATCYIQILNFDRHQNPHKNEAASEIPPMPQGAKINSSRDNEGDEPADSPESIGNREKDGTSTVQTPKQHSTNRADSLNTDSLNTDSGFLETEGSATAPSSDSPYALLESLCETQGHDVSVLSKRDKDKQLAVAKRLIADGMTVHDTARMTKWLMAQSWITGGIDLFLVEKQVGKWRLAGMPDTVTQQGRPSQKAPKEDAWQVYGREHGYIDDAPDDVIDTSARRTA